MTLDADALNEAARSVLHKRISPDFFDTVGEGVAKRWKYSHDSELATAAITAYLSALSEKGVRLMPREPSIEMTDAADVDLGLADVYVITGMRGIAVPKHTPQDQVRLFGSARANLWRAMFDAHSEPKP